VRLPPKTIGLIAAWPLISVVSVPVRVVFAAQADARVEAPVVLERQAECMYQMLKTIPRINEPFLMHVQSKGWRHPAVGYLATWREGLYKIIFEAQQPLPRVLPYKGYWFLLSFSGPPPPGLDLEQTESVMKRWKAECQTDSDLWIN
jgi:hypothetical protein